MYAKFATLLGSMRSSQICRSGIVVFVAVIGLALLSPRVATARKYTHEILPGETLKSIAKRYHITPRKIRRWNKIKGSHLRAGRKLRIISKAPVRRRFKARYKVRKRDNLTRIARKHKMSRRLLRRLNRKIDWKRLRYGQLVWVVTSGPRPKGVAGMYKLAGSSGFIVRNPTRAWGTFLAVTRLMEVLTDHSRAYPRRTPLRVDDISRKGGGFLAPHRSHRSGRDVDIRYPLKTATDKYVRASTKTLDLERTWDLLKRFLATKDVTYIFVERRFQKLLHARAVKARWSKSRLKEVFQYPRGRKAMTGIIRHEPGHSTHFHVRFRKEQPPNS
jgi:LysM domain/Penicillin-insensitive murein endopeptidase